MAAPMTSSFRIEEIAPYRSQVYIDDVKVSSVVAIDVALRVAALPLVTLTFAPRDLPMRLDAVDLRVVLSDTPEAVQRSLMRCLQEKYAE